MLTRQMGWKMMLAQFVFAGMAAAVMAQTTSGNQSAADARVILVMTDGLRWQEVFVGRTRVCWFRRGTMRAAIWMH